MATLGGLLRNPLIAGVLAANALGETAGAYNAMQQPQDDQFVRQAQVSGVPVTEMPRTGLLGHFLGPIQATQDQLAKEKLALRDQTQTAFGNTVAAGGLAAKLGKDPFNDLI